MTILEVLNGRSSGSLELMWQELVRSQGSVRDGVYPVPG